MVAEFERMIFDLNDGLHHAGLVSDDYYFTGFHFIMSMVVSTILLVGYNKIVVWSDWYEERQEFFQERLPLITLVVGVSEIVIVALYFKAYGEILFFLIVVSITLLIGTRKEFAGFRAWLDEKFGWLL